jgi:1,4-alpha-glucan branching enzyme
MQMIKKQRRLPEPVNAKSPENVSVEFLLEKPNASSVAVAGNFNDWDPRQTPPRKDAGGAWRAMVLLPPGRYEYRFVVDDQWFSDPQAKESVPNPFGSVNAVRVVEAPPTTPVSPTAAWNKNSAPLSRQLRA